MGLFYRLEELVNDFPTGTPRSLIEFLQEVLKALLRLVKRTNNAGTLSWICYLIEQDLSGVLTWLDNAHTAQTPRALVRVLEEIAEKLSPRSQLIVAPDYECNYSTFDLIRWFRSLLENLLSQAEMRRIFRGLPDEIQLVQFPRIERDHVLNHVIFGHEFGHPIAEKFLATYEQSSSRYRTQVLEVINELKRLQTQRGLRGKKRDDRQKEDFKEVEEIWRRGLEELISDVVGTYIFGPSAFFAAVDNFSASRLDDVPQREEYYPPARYRYRVMHQLLQERGHFDALLNVGYSSGVSGVEESVPIVLEYLQHLVANRNDGVALRQDPLCDIAYRWLEETLPSAMASAQDQCLRLGLVYSPDVVLRETPELLERLAIAVPPADMGVWPTLTLIDWRSSVLAGWLTKLSHSLNSKLSAELAAKETHAINKLTIKGIEYAVLAKDYGENRKRGFER